MALKANPNILECPSSRGTPLGEELLALRQQFLSQMIFQTFNGYALSQFKKNKQDRRNLGETRRRMGFWSKPGESKPDRHGSK